MTKHWVNNLLELEKSLGIQKDRGPGEPIAQPINKRSLGKEVPLLRKKRSSNRAYNWGHSQLVQKTKPAVKKKVTNPILPKNPRRFLNLSKKVARPEVVKPIAKSTIVFHHLEAVKKKINKPVFNMEKFIEQTKRTEERNYKGAK